MSSLYEQTVNSYTKGELIRKVEVGLIKKSVKGIHHLVKSKEMYFMTITYLVFMLTTRNRYHK